MSEPMRSIAAHNYLPEFLKQMVLTPIFKRKVTLLRIAIALGFLSVAQVAILFLVKGFLVAFFANPAEASIAASELIPAKLQHWFPHLPGISIQKDLIAWLVPACIVGAGMMQAFANYWYNFSQEEIALRVASNYREKMFSAILKLPYLSSARRNAGEWMSVIMVDAQFLQTRLADLLTGFVKDGVLVFACFVGLALVHGPAALVLALIAPFIGWSMGRAGKRISFFAEAFQTELGKLAGSVLDMRARFRYMKSQHGEAFERHVFEEANQKYLNMITGSIFIRALVTPAMEWVGFAIFAGFIFAWTHGYMGTSFTPEVVVQFFAALGLMLRPIRQMGEQVARWGETMGGLRRSMTVFREVQAESQESVLEALESSSSKIHMRPLIEIHKVQVRYGERTAFAAQDVVLASGRAVAIVGASGAGKSTLLKCLAGLIEPTIWQSSLPWQEAVAHCAFVSQTPFLFQDTIRQNLLYGLPEDILAETTDEMLYAALRVLSMADQVRSLPLGLETVFNPVAYNLSGGQIQRLVVARALLRRRPILLLDEATAAIDGATEREMTQCMIDTVHDSGTILVSVTHRLTWLELYDEIWFVRDGKIALRGRHLDLLRDDSYRRFTNAEAAKEVSHV